MSVANARLENVVGEFPVGYGGGELDGRDQQREKPECGGLCGRRVGGMQVRGNRVGDGLYSRTLGVADRCVAAPDLIEQARASEESLRDDG